MKKIISSMILSALLVPTLVGATEFSIDTSVNYDSTKLSCISTAITIREDNIIVAQDAYSASIKSARLVRRDAIKTAWLIADTQTRNTAIKLAETNFKNSSKLASDNLQNVKSSSRTTMITSLKTCGIFEISTYKKDKLSVKEDRGENRIEKFFGHYYNKK